MKHRFSRFAVRARALAALAAWCVGSALAFVAPAQAEVDIRVEGRPTSEPVEAYIKVTNNNVPVSGLGASDFRIWVDDVEVTIQPGDFILPPAQGGPQNVSVVLVMDYSGTVQSTALAALESAVKGFIDQMALGDEAAIIKFNNTLGVSLVHEFVPIDGAANNASLEAAVDSDYSGTGTPLLDALLLAVNQFVTPPHTLPAGPKAIILVSDGGENQSDATQSEVIALANENSIPIFTIGVGDVTQPGRTQLMEELGEETGGLYYPPAPNDEHIEEAYASIAELLSNEYLLRFEDGITDCAVHSLRVKVTGQVAVKVRYTRRACDTEPNQFAFAAQTGVDPNAMVTSDGVTITGLSDGVPAHISVIQGSYSIGCDGTFTASPGQLADGETVCVQQQASGSFSTSKTTTLTIGGIAGTFTVTTRGDSGGGGGGGGGGGASGLFELMLLCGLGALLLMRRRAT
jgi:VWFA-related protein